MASKKVVYLGAICGMTIGALVPMLWGDSSVLGMASILLSAAGGLLGIWIAFWVGKYLG